MAHGCADLKGIGMTIDQKEKSIEALKRDYLAKIAGLRSQGRKLSCLHQRCDILLARIEATQSYVAAVQKIARA